MNWKLLLFPVLLFAASAVGSKKPKPAGNKGPVVILDNPANGWSSLKIVKLKGRILNAGKITEAKLTVNSFESLISVVNGTFTTDVLLASNVNYINVRVENDYGVDSKSLKLMTQNEKIDLQLICNWDTDQTYIDLHITDPTGETVLWSHPNSKIGGVLTGHDIYGYGPQIFTLARALPGEYTVKINYFESGQGNPTMARVVVILYQGSEKEVKSVYPTMVHTKGEMITIAKFKIDN